jgi:hypothetical protein
MRPKTLSWNEFSGELILQTPKQAQSYKCRPGSQAHTLIDALSKGPLPKERLIRKVFDMKGLSPEDVKVLDGQLKVLVSRINRALQDKSLSVDDGIYSFRKGLKIERLFSP